MIEEYKKLNDIRISKDTNEIYNITKEELDKIKSDYKFYVEQKLKFTNDEEYELFEKQLMKKYGLKDYPIQKSYYVFEDKFIHIFIENNVDEEIMQKISDELDIKIKNTMFQNQTEEDNKEYEYLRKIADEFEKSEFYVKYNSLKKDKELVKIEIIKEFLFTNKYNLNDSKKLKNVIESMGR